MLPYLLNGWRRWRHLLFDHIHFQPLDDASVSGPLIGHTTPGESDVERHAREDTLAAIRDGHPSSPAFDPTRHLHVVDRGGLGPRVDDEG